MTAIILSLSNLTVVAAVVIFLALTLLLVVILLVAKARLMPAGNRRITINGERTVETPAGATLLASLASNRYSCPRLAGAEAAAVCAVAGSCREEGRYCLPRPDFLPASNSRSITGWPVR